MLLNEKNSRLTLCGELALLVAVIIKRRAHALLRFRHQRHQQRSICL